jgi:DNA polymerase-3 subunit epsilon
MSASIGAGGTNTHLAAVLDVETTGWQAAVDEIIEVGAILFAFDPSCGEILQLVDCYSGLREPRVGIHPAAQEVHGLSLAMLRGQRLDEERLGSLFSRAEFLIAHNASFDRGFLTRLFPETGEKPWLCSMRGIDWLTAGCPGRSLELLRSHFGLESGGHHRAAVDAATTLALLSKRDCSSRPFFGHLLARLPERVAEMQRRREQTPLPRRPRVAHRYRGCLAETVAETFAAGPVEITVEHTVLRRRDPGPAARELMDLLSGIVADGVIDADEFRLLDQWLMQNSDLTREFPFNVLATQLSTILEGGRIELEELERLREVVLQILHPKSLGCIDLSTVKETPITQPPPRISFAGKMFVFTGRFYFGEKSQCARATTDKGGICKGSVTRATDYVVVGGKGSPEWIYGNYGSKIAQAVENIRNGCTTAILSEEHWVAALE